MEIVISKFRSSELGDIKFATYKEYDDAYSRWIRNDWKVEPVTLLGCTLLAEGEKFIDLGANIGAFCVPLALLRKSPFLAIEALHDNVYLLQQAVAENGLQDSVIVNAAIMDQESTVHVKGQSAYGTVNDDGVGIAVPSVTGDKLFDEVGFMDAKLVKIDIEGAELKALLGMKDFMAMDIARSYIFEANGAHAYDGGYTPSDIVKIFENIGYKIFMIVNHKLVPYSSDELQPFGLINYLAIQSLPSSLEYGFHVINLNDKEIIDGIVRTLTQMKPGYRYFMMQELEKAPSSIRNHKRVIEAVADSAMGT